LGRSQDWT